jgi:hypothetical protein
MREKIIKVISYVAVGYSVASIGYTALPQEMLDMLPQVNDMIAWVTGGSSGLIGMALMYVDSKIQKNNAINDEKVNAVASNFIELTKSYKEVKGELSNLKGAYVELKDELVRVRKVNEASLQVKLSNKFIDEKARELAERVLNDEN